MDHATFVRLLRPGDGVLDLGCHEGYNAREYAEQVGQDGCVLAVDADADSVRTAIRLSLAVPQIRVKYAAVGSESGRRTFYLDAGDRKRDSLYATNIIEAGLNSVDTPTVTVDDLASDVPHLHAIKMDIQGAECEALSGALETLRRPDVRWWVEVWPMGLEAAGGSVRELAAQFTAADYKPTGCEWSEVIAYGDRETVRHGSWDILVTWKGLL